MAEQTALLMAYYGDDFTGSTDALESLAVSGAKTRLFMSPPSAEQLAAHPGLQAVGVAGLARSMTPDEMSDRLTPAFQALKSLGAPHVHYKVCSTFDSSPTLGSIGKVIDLASRVFERPFVPLVVGTPKLGRYCVFGNLFARLGDGSDIFRIDRHPSMSRHPVTPAEESDLRLHLARQTHKRIDLIDIVQVSGDPGALTSAVDNAVASGAEVILFDVLYEEHLRKIGKILDDHARPACPLFTVGSSAVETALTGHWIDQAQLEPVEHWAHPGASDRLLVASGSGSPVSEAQIAWALRHGYREVALDTEAMVAQANGDAIPEQMTKQVVAYLEQGHSVVLHTCRGPDDPRLAQTLAALERLDTYGLASMQWTAQHFGAALGKIVRAAMLQTGVRRLVIAGGDTSGHLAGALGLVSLEMIAPLVPGAPLCRGHIPGSPLDGVTLNFKGGQVGGEDYFERVRLGTGKDL